MQPNYLLLLASILQSAFSASDDLVAQFLKDTSDAVCNDGSAPLYYKRLNPESSEWMIFLEGGGLCHDHDSCISRYEVMPYFMSSTSAPSTQSATGVLSANCEINPVFCGYNIIMAHYCSSDLWSGDQEYTPGDSEPDIFRFKGRNILKAMLKQIVETYSEISQASRIFIGGASAGSEGAQFQGDRLFALLEILINTSNIDLRILADSGWFHSGPGLIPDYCNAFICNHEIGTRDAAKYMNIEFDQSCEEYYGKEESWKCGFPLNQEVLELIETPTFFTTYIYDQVQIEDDGISAKSLDDFTVQEKSFALKRGSETTDRITGVENSRHGFYAINCFHHVMSNLESQINSLTIEGVTFNDAVQKWLDGKEEVKLVDDKCGDILACNPQCPVAQVPVEK